MTKHKILVLDSCVQFRNAICDVLDVENDIEIVGELSNEREFVEQAQQTLPSIVLMDFEQLMRREVREAIQILTENNADIENAESLIPTFLLMCAAIDESMIQQVPEGLKYKVIAKPLRPDSLLKSIRGISSAARCELVRRLETKRNLEALISSILHKIGVPAHVKGNKYLRDSIVVALNDPSMLDNKSDGIYEILAKKYQTKRGAADRAMRLAIEMAWDKPKNEYLYTLFDYSQGKPRITEFIANIVNHIELKA